MILTIISFPGWQGWRHETVKEGLPQDDGGLERKVHEGGLRQGTTQFEYSRQRYFHSQAFFLQDGTTIETSTAAALLAATYSGGDPTIGENIAQLLVPEMGENVDQNMMAALMSSGSMIQVGSKDHEKMHCTGPQDRVLLPTVRSILLCFVQ